jgi:hypothetical protein
MKKLILLYISFVCIEVNAQTIRPANIEIPITVFDNSGMPFNSRILTCGIDSMATDSIDSFLGENWLYCPWDSEESGSDCIPFDHFEAILDLPVSSGGFGLWGSHKDFRFGEIPYSGTIVHKISYCVWSAATAIYISWDFPEGVSGVLQDPFGGVIFNYPMPDSGTFTDPYFFFLYEVNLILTYENVTPVESISFTASVLQNEKAVQLNWSTATETNNSGFEIERLQDSKIERLKNWETIGFVPGFGTTTEPKSYSFTDENITTGTYKYRLKQIDFDGTFEYSNELEVAIDFTPKEFVLYQNFPNPFNPSTTIKYSLPVESFVKINIYNALGEVIEKLVSEMQNYGTYEIIWDAKNYSSGIYYYSFEVNSADGSQSHREMKKIVFLK